MKILIYTHQFPPARGGAGVYSHDLAVGLSSLHQDVHVLTSASAPSSNCVPEPAQRDGLNIHYLASWQTGTDIVGLVVAWLQLRHQFDLILVAESLAQKVIAGIEPGAIHYGTVIHGTDIMNCFGARRAARSGEKHKMACFYERAAIGIAVSHATLRLAQGLLGSTFENLVVVQNGIDLARLPPVNVSDSARLRRKYGTQTEIVFCLGRLDLDKGQDTLIRAFAKVRRSRPQAHLLIGGDGPSMASLDHLRCELGLTGCIELVGSIPSAELPAYFDSCDLFVLTSRCENRWEGFGLVYLEAGFYGKAVLGGNEGGVPEAIADQVSGLVVAPRDEDAIASAMIALLGDEQRRTEMGRQGRERVLSYFNSRRMAEETLAHLESVRQTRSPGFRLRQGVLLVAHLIKASLRAIVCAGRGATGYLPRANASNRRAN